MTLAEETVFRAPGSVWSMKGKLEIHLNIWLVRLQLLQIFHKMYFLIIKLIMIKLSILPWWCIKKLHILENKISINSRLECTTQFLLHHSRAGNSQREERGEKVPGSGHQLKDQLWDLQPIAENKRSSWYRPREAAMASRRQAHNEGTAKNRGQAPPKHPGCCARPQGVTLESSRGRAVKPGQGPMETRFIPSGPSRHRFPLSQRSTNLQKWTGPLSKGSREGNYLWCALTLCWYNC